jgi:acyl carrier protein
MGTKGYTYFGAERRPLPKKSHRKTKPTFTERLREIVAEAIGVDTEEITDSYPIKQESDLSPNGLLDLIEIAMVIEKEYEFVDIFSEDNEQVFESFGTLLGFMKGMVKQ